MQAWREGGREGGREEGVGEWRGFGGNVGERERCGSHFDGRDEAETMGGERGREEGRDGGREGGKKTYLPHVDAVPDRGETSFLQLEDAHAEQLDGTIMPTEELLDSPVVREGGREGGREG